MRGSQENHGVKQTNSLGHSFARRKNGSEDLLDELQKIADRLFGVQVSCKEKFPDEADLIDEHQTQVIHEVQDAHEKKDLRKEDIEKIKASLEEKLRKTIHTLENENRYGNMASVYAQANS